MSEDSKIKSKKNRNLSIALSISAALNALILADVTYGYSVIHKSVSTVSGSIPMSVGNPSLEFLLIVIAILTGIGFVASSIFAYRFATKEH